MNNDVWSRIESVLSRLISFDTVSVRSNLPLIEYIETYLQAFGLEVCRFLDPTGQKAGLWVTIGPAAEPGIVLSGHTDVVPVTGQSWSSDPFALVERDGRLYGRGTADMKGFLAVCLAMVPEMVGANLRMPLHFAFSYDEELGALGVRPMLDEINKLRPKPLACFVGEPTDMRVVIGHKGKHSIRATVNGLACHTSLAPRGVNAVHHAAELITEIARRANAFQTDGGRDDMYDIPHSTILASIVNGGIAQNIVPDKCVLEIEARGLGAHESKGITDALIAWANAEIVPRMSMVREGCGIAFEEIREFPGLDMPAGHALVSLAQNLLGQNTADKVGFGTEAGLFVSMADIPSVVVGPGSISQAHTPDEFIEKSQLIACANFLARLIKHCRRSGSLGSH